MTGRFIAIVGPSGVGKDSVMEALAAAEPSLKLVRRVITRPGDAGGEEFDAVTEAEFLQRKARGDFVLSWQAHDLRYGIPVATARDLADGRDVLANLSRSVLPAARAVFPSLQVIVLTASRDVLARRLAARNRETAKDIAQRLDRADFAMPPEISAFTVDNSGPLGQTVDAILTHLATGSSEPRPATCESQT